MELSPRHNSVDVNDDDDTTRVDDVYPIFPSVKQTELKSNNHQSSLWLESVCLKNIDDLTRIDLLVVN